MHNNNILRSIWRTLAALVVASVSTGLVSWVMRRKVDITKTPFEIVRPSAWTVLGVSCALIPVAVLIYFVGIWLFERPGATTEQNRMTRAVALGIAGLLFASSFAVAAMQDPLADADSKSIALRGLLSGIAVLVAGLLIMLLIHPMERELNQLREWLEMEHAGREARDLHIDACEQELANAGITIPARPDY